MVKVAVLVSGGGTNLQAIIDARKNGVISSADISLVVSSCSEAYALTRAANNGIKSTSVLPQSYKNNEDFAAALIDVLEENGIDLIVLAGYLCILPKSFTDKYPNRIINVHPSLIPSFCGEGFYGLTVHEKALEYGVKVSGATVHFVNEVVDGGKIILQKAVDIKENDTPEILQRRVMEEAEWDILPRAVELLARNMEDIN